MPNYSTMRSATLVELRAALAVAEYRSFRAGAMAMGMSASVFSGTVRTLEDRLGVRLFNRTTRSVAPTSAGEEFIASVIPLLAELDRAMEAASGHGSDPKGKLRINSSVTGAHQILVPLVRTFLEAYPDVEVEIATETRLVDIVLEGYDAGIRLSETVPVDMVAVPLSVRLDFCVVASPGYLDGNEGLNSPDDLMKHRCIRAKTPNGRISRWEFERHGESMALDVRGTLTLDEQSLMLKAAINDMGLACIARTFAEEAVSDGRLRFVLEDWAPSSTSLCLYYPRNRNTSAALRALIDMIRSEKLTQQ